MGVRDQIINANDRPLVPVECPEWGCTVYVCASSVDQAIADDDAVEKMTVSALAGRVCRCALDADGNRIFADTDAAAVSARAFAPVLRIARAHAALNGMDAEKK